MPTRAEQLHASPWQGVFYLTGGGSLLLSELLTTAGASATVLEARVPYARVALTQLLGREPAQACSEPTARALAMAAFQRALELGARVPFGLACTASLATGRVKRGIHRAHVAVQTEAATLQAHLTFRADRASEERALLELLWHALAAALELDIAADLPHAPEISRTEALAHWQDLILARELAWCSASHDGRLLFPGAFNPLHQGHRRMLEIAQARTGLAGAFELSIVNVDKPLLDYTEIDSRLRQFDRPVWLTRLPTFLDKARFFEQAHFVVGVDTLVRIADSKYYGSEAARDLALAELVRLNARFVVFGRQLDGRFQVLSDLHLPEPLAALCEEIGEHEFHEPVSSTQLRGG